MAARDTSPATRQSTIEERVAALLARMTLAEKIGQLTQVHASDGDPAAYLELPGENDTVTRVLILRDIEMGRARQHALVDRVACPADFTPDDGLSGDRETATAQAAAECMRRAEVQSVRADRSLPLIFVDMLRQADIAVEYDPDLGVVDRRAKDEEEIAWIREAQAVSAIPYVGSPLPRSTWISAAFPPVRGRQYFRVSRISPTIM